MKEKLIYVGKIAIVIIVLFAMAYSDLFPIYWRFASGFWFLICVGCALYEGYSYLKRFM